MPAKLLESPEVQWRTEHGINRHAELAFAALEHFIMRHHITDLAVCKSYIDQIHNQYMNKEKNHVS